MTDDCKVQEAITPNEILACWPVIQELRPHLIKNELIEKVQQQQKDEGYRLMYISKGENEPVAILGFRILNFLWSGKTLYIDDLCTLSSTHGKGYAGKLLDWVNQYGIEQNCNALSLDSGYTRNNAHRLYLNKGYLLKSHHFHKDLK